MAGEVAQQQQQTHILPLSGRVAIVTGGSRGIGRAISLHLHSLGAKVVINYASNSAQADLLAAQLTTAAQPSAVAIQADVSDPDQVTLLFNRTEEIFGSAPDILVCCAGAMDFSFPSLSNTSLKEWDRTFEVNTKGVFLCCREAVNRLKPGGGGWGRIIVVTTSLVGMLPPGFAAYIASKAAAEAMTKVLAKELKGTGITANCVAPGATSTESFYTGKSEATVKRLAEMCPMGRIGEPDDIAPVVGMLASDAGGWINGQVIRVNGGAII